MADTLTPTESLKAAFSGTHGPLKVSYEMLRSMCGGEEAEAALITPSVRCVIWRTGKSKPTLKHCKARIVGYMALAPGDTLSLESADSREGCVRIVPIPRGSSELYVPQPRIGRPAPVKTQ